MKRRILLGIWVLALALLVMPVVAAQDSKAVWDLTESLKFTDLGFNVLYPSGWVYDATDSSGVFFASNKSDITAATDGDNTTLGSDSTIQLIATQIEGLKDAVGDNPSLDDLIDFLLKSRGVTENEKRVEIPVLSRRTLSALGEDEAKQGWIITVWRQGDFAVGAFLTSPNYEETVRVAYSWGQMMASITPNDALPLSKNTIDLPGSSAEINYPEGWYPNPDHPNVVYELKTDLKNSTSEGSLVLTAEQTLADLKLKDDATLDDVVDANITSLELKEPVRREEFIMLGQPAISIRGTDGSGQYLLMAQTIIDGTVLQIATIGKDEAAIDSLEPTFLAMLQTLHSTKAS
jgi:hypothetical protein